jgi:predicted transcriptional regulator YheO
MDEHDCIFASLKSIATVMVKTFGRNCEIAIHDFNRLPNSLIYIEGNQTRRKPGAPITDLVLRALRREGDNVADICNYKNITKEGAVLKSSTAFIRNSSGKVIGAFCINFCIVDYMNAITMLQEFTQISKEGREEGHVEFFASSLKETIESLLETAIQKAGKQPATMTREEKVSLVASLEYEGAFLIKGSVGFVAKAMGVSIYTVYNYLKEVRSSTDSTNVIR